MYISIINIKQNPTLMKQKIDFAVGGQALMEGVMMRSPNHVSLAVRSESGKIFEHSYFYKNIIQKYKFLNLPILRGAINMIEMLIIGTKAMNYSTDIFTQELDATHTTKTQNSKNTKNSKTSTNSTNNSDSTSSSENADNAGSTQATAAWVQNLMLVLSLFFAFGLAVVIFKLLPLAAASFASSKFQVLEQNYILFNSFDALVKILLFAAYLKALHFSKTLRRVFGFHAAEHMSIAAYEKDLELNQANIREQTRFHPRCGTSFLVFVFVLSIFVYTFLPQASSFALNLLYRVLCLPLLAGIAYEILKYAGRNPDSRFARFVSMPGLYFQRLTTLPPEADMLEVAAVSLKNALRLETNYQAKQAKPSK